MPSLIAKVSADTTAFKSGMDRVRADAAGLKNSFSSMGSAITGALAGISVAGIATGIKSLIDDFDRMGDLATRLDVSSESLQRMAGIAKLTGGETETLAKSLTTLEKQFNAVGGPSSAVTDALDALGINAQKFAALSLEEKLYALSDAYVASEGNAQRMAAVMTLLGKSGSELIPTLKEGSAALREIGESISIVKDDDIAKIQAFNDQFDALIMSGKALAATLATIPLEKLTGIMQSAGKGNLGSAMAQSGLLLAPGAFAAEQGQQWGRSLFSTSEGTGGGPTDSLLKPSTAPDIQKAFDAQATMLEQGAKAMMESGRGTQLSSAFNITEDAVNLGRYQEDSLQGKLAGMRDRLTWDMTNGIGAKTAPTDNQPAYISSLARIGGGGGIAGGGMGDAMLGESRRQTGLLATIAAALKPGGSGQRAPAIALG